MAAFHDRIKEWKELVDKLEVLVLRNPENTVYRQLFDHSLKRYKSALINDPPL